MASMLSCAISPSHASFLFSTSLFPHPPLLRSRSTRVCRTSDSRLHIRCFSSKNSLPFHRKPLENRLIDVPSLSNFSLLNHGTKKLERAIAAILVLVQILSPLPLADWEPWFGSPARAVLYSPDTKVPRTGELALRKAIPANSSMKAMQDSLEDISYLLRIPQRKPYGTMEGDAKKALKIAVDEKESILNNIPTDLREKGSVLYASLVDGKGRLKTLIDSIKDNDADKVSVSLASSLDTIADKGKFECSQETLERVRKIYQDFPQISVPQNLLGDDDDMQKLAEALGAAKTRVEGCSSFLKAAIRWSAEFGAPGIGSLELHYMLAEYIYSQSPELDMTKVSFHFVRGGHPEKFAATLVNFMGKCYPGEDDLAIARAVLMYLSLGNMKDANYLIDEIKKRKAFPESELTQFIVYLLQTLERDAFPLFRILRQKYKTSIDKEPAFDELLDEIGERFYGVRRRSGLQGVFGDFFKMMGGEVAA